MLTFWESFSDDDEGNVNLGQVELHSGFTIDRSSAGFAAKSPGKNINIVVSRFSGLSRFALLNAGDRNGHIIP